MQKENLSQRLAKKVRVRRPRDARMEYNKIMFQFTVTREPGISEFINAVAGVNGITPSKSIQHIIKYAMQQCGQDVKRIPVVR